MMFFASGTRDEGNNNKLTASIRDIHGPRRKERNDDACFWRKR